MVDTTPYAYKALAGDEVEKGDKAVITGAGEFQEFEHGTALVIPIDYKKQQREIIMNKGNTRRLGEAFGRDSENWTGKVIKLSCVELTSFGKRVKSLWVEANGEE